MPSGLTVLGVAAVVIAYWIFKVVAGFVMTLIGIVLVVAVVAAAIWGVSAPAALTLPALATRTRAQARARGPLGWRPVHMHGGVAEWFKQGPAKPRTAVRFRPPPLNR